MAILNYNKVCSRNAAGNSRIFLAEAPNITNIVVTAGEISTITGALAFKEIEADTDTIIRTESKIEGKYNARFDAKVEMKFEKQSKNLNTLLDSLAEASPCGILALIRDNNGTWWLVGYNENDLLSRGLRVSIDEMTSGGGFAEEGAGLSKIEFFRNLAAPSMPLNSTLSAQMDAETAAFAQFVGIYVSEYQAVYDSLTTKPSAAIAYNQDAMVRALINAGVWAKLDLFYLFAQTVNSASEALKNWILPGTHDASLVNAPAFVALEGFTGNGSTSYINTGWDATTDGVNYIQDSASAGVYIRTNIAGTETDIGARSAAGRFQISPRVVGDEKQAIGPNDLTALNDANTDSRGMFVLTRTASNARALYKNKVANSDSEASTGIFTDDVFILANNNFGAPNNHSTRQVACAIIGGGLTQANVDALTDAVEAYMDSNGKGVIA